jgi:hypothetical protein
MHALQQAQAGVALGLTGAACAILDGASSIVSTTSVPHPA